MIYICDCANSNFFLKPNKNYKKFTRFKKKVKKVKFQTIIRLTMSVGLASST